MAGKNSTKQRCGIVGQYEPNDDVASEFVEANGRHPDVETEYTQFENSEHDSDDDDKRVDDLVLRRQPLPENRSVFYSP